KGLVASPGFIDFHSHTDFRLLVNPKAESKIRQGVTTEVFPNCGSGPAPILGEWVPKAEEELQKFGLKLTWSTLAEFHKKVEEKGTAINVVTTVPHSNVRVAVIGYENREPTPSELDEMKNLVDQGMRDGAYGLCAGLRYVPGSYAEIHEMIELCKVAAKYDGFYTSHIRSEGDRGSWIDAIQEAIEIGRKSGARIQISHLKALGRKSWGLSTQVLQIIDNAREEGLDITGDQYPYPATGVGLLAMVPKWSHEGGNKKFFQRLKNKEDREKIKKGIEESIEDRGGPEKAVVSSFPPNRPYEGKSILEISKLVHKDPIDTILQLLETEEKDVGIVNFVMKDEDVENIMRHPHVMVSTDGSALAPHGPLSEGKPHPRNYGTYAKMLGEYVREKRILRLEEAIRKMTSLPAQKIGLKNRGMIAKGMHADIVIFDPGAIRDVATFEEPHKFPQGIKHVIVNGQLVVRDEIQTDALPGLVLRRGM
ncbi:MAG: D-aminoacylase, partial [archaeon]